MLHFILNNQQFAQYIEISKLFALKKDKATKIANRVLTALITIKTLPFSMNQTYHYFNHLKKVNLYKLATIVEIEIYSIFFLYKIYIFTKIIKIIIQSLAAYTIWIMNLFNNNFVGSITAMEYNKALYFQMTIDDYSHARQEQLLTSKAQAFTNIQNLNFLFKIQIKGISIH